MKKIININLSGRVIPIEDSAYEKLQGYIESLRRYFSHEDGRDEIINDIESRIAELMNEKVRKGASCVTDADIDEIIASMGRPEDFDADTTETSTSSSSSTRQEQREYSRTERKSRGRLYRDTSDKFIGGVCSGIAAYLNTDPAIVRILFAIITFGGFGLGFLVYILLWMILPTRDLEGQGYSGKRLYRNPEDKVIGGVAGGLAAYFNRETWVIRLIFAAPFVFSIFFGILKGMVWHYDFDFFPNVIFGSLSSTFVLAYIILWAVLPEARSTYEKMEMRGEKVDVNTIRQNVKEGMDNMKDRVKTFSEEVKDSAQQFGTKAKEFASSRGKTFASEVGEVAGRSGRGIGHAIGVLFKVFFLFIAGSIAFGLFVGLMALLFGGIAWWPVNNYLWTSKWQQLYAWGTLIFFLLVPLIGLITWIIRRIIGARSRSGYLGWTFGALWTLGWVCAILFASSLTKDFRSYEHTDIEIPTVQPANNRMIVAVTAPELQYTGNFSWVDNESQGWDFNGDTARLSTVRFHIVKSSDSAYHVTAKKYSYGRSEEEALRRAERIQYSIVSKDSLLDLGNGYTVDRQSKFRGQQVEIEIQVPVGKRIRFDESVNEKLNPSSFRIKRKYRRNRVVDIDFENDDAYMNRFRSDIDYVMGADGILKDNRGDNIIKDNYRYNSEEADSIRLKELLQEDKKREDEIKELQQKQKQKPTTELKVEKTRKDVAINDTPLPILSEIKWF